MSRYVLILLLCLLPGCSMLQSLATDAVLGADKGLDVDANVAKGDAEGAGSNAQNANTAVSVGGSTNSEYGAVESVVNEAGMETHELLLLVLLAGWAIPSPRQMFLGVFGTLGQGVKLLRGRRT